jgi:hypothetical protein
MMIAAVGIAMPGAVHAFEPPTADDGATVAAEAEPTAVPDPEPTTPAETAGVPDAAWSAVQGKQVTIETADGNVEGELAKSDGDTLVVIADDGTVQTLPKADAKAVRVRKTQPPVAAKPVSPVAPPVVEDDDGDKKKDEKKDDKKKKREHALLGAFTAHGAAYMHQRGDGVSAGHAAYAMDWGIGINPTPGFGMYAMGGGLLGAKIDNKSIKANYGHLAFMFAFGGKYYFSMLGAGVAFNRLAFDNETQKDIGLALPMKLFGRLPLPKNLYIGIGLSYELGLVRDWNRVVNGIGGQIVFGRW